MLYKINNEYYVKVGMKYAKVEFVIKDNNVSLKPTSTYVEKNDNMVVVEQPFNDSFKESLIKKQTRKSDKIEDSNKNTKISYRR